MEVSLVPQYIFSQKSCTSYNKLDSFCFGLFSFPVICQGGLSLVICRNLSTLNTIFANLLRPASQATYLLK